MQLAVKAGAKVIGLASKANHEWLAAHGIIPIAYGNGVADRITEAAGGRVSTLSVGATSSSLDQVRDAYRELERRHTRGKIVLRP